MSTYKAVFSDIDGTLLTSEHIVSTATIEAIASLQDKNIPFVIISSRSASCIYPILEKHHFQCPIVACGGAWIEDMNGRILYRIYDRKKIRSRMGHLFRKELDYK